MENRGMRLDRGCMTALWMRTFAIHEGSQMQAQARMSNVIKNRA